MFFKRKKRKINDDIELIFNTQSNNQFDDLMERPLEKKAYLIYVFIFLAFLFIFIFRLYQMQIIEGSEYYKEALKNLRKEEYVFFDRGIVKDRNNKVLIWNYKKEDGIVKRKYIQDIGLSHILGFVSYPKKDKNKKYFVKTYLGRAGVEKYFNNYLNGKVGKKIIEINARGQIISNNIFIKPEEGKNLKLTIDLDLQKSLALALKKYIEEDGFVGASGIIMNTKTGEILASVSLPEYDSNIMAEAKDKVKIKEWLLDKSNPFLNRTFLGGYTPGSTVKPFVALAGLEENIMTADWKIKTNGKLILPNKWNPSKPTIFVDWKNQGVVDMYKALANSSNIYFYIIGGGLNGILNYSNREGLGIKRLVEYYKKFGFGSYTKIEKFKEKRGNLPTPEWKEKHYKTRWTIADTYFTSIGQFAFLATPLQLVVATSIIVNDGQKIRPIISDLEKKGQILESYNFKKKNLEAVKKGMRMVVTQGTGRALNFDFVKIAGKSGTAQIKNNTRVNSWFIGFWPYENPKYVFVVLGDNGPKHYKHSVAWGMRTFFLDLKEKFGDKYFK